MLRWAVIFFVISIIAALFGFTDIAAGAAGIAKALFFIFLAIFVVFLVLGLTVAKKITPGA
ncbi:MAG TPA: DUF1328 domain-containing protein [Nitrospirales bacterium]|nr:DUF1328 domain-containing protein [Nitrospirales bacterium]